MNLIKSKQRVADHGEVCTPPWLVDAMLDLVQGEAERIAARFLEPACGSGNFLVPILQRKLAAVEQQYGASDFEKRHYALLALMCCYGIELLADNVAECRARLLATFSEYLRWMTATPASALRRMCWRPTSFKATHWPCAPGRVSRWCLPNGPLWAKANSSAAISGSTS